MMQLREFYKKVIATHPEKLDELDPCRCELEDFCDENVVVPRKLMEKMLVFFWTELEDYTGARRDDYDADASVSQIIDALDDIFDEDACEEFFPGTFCFDDDEEAELDDRPLGSSLTKENLKKAEEYKVNVQKSSR